MSYISEVKEHLVAKRPTLAERPGLLDLYLALAFAKASASPEEAVHHSWGINAEKHNPGDEDLKWFELLSAEVQEYDKKYATLIDETAQWIVARKRELGLIGAIGGDA